MKIKRAASIPLITHDPFFSIWSPADQLHDTNTVHWSGAPQRLKGFLLIDGKKHVFLGERIGDGFLPQTAVEVTATATCYTFENEKLRMTCRFTSPLLLDDPLLISRPCSYIDLTVEKKKPCEVAVTFAVTGDLCRTGSDPLTGFSGSFAGYPYAMMGRAVQQPLSGSDDRTTINWGYAYLACGQKRADVCFHCGAQELQLTSPVESGRELNLILAYDDLLSINYFG